MPLLSQLIHQHFDAETLNRGHEYAKNDHVLNVKLRDGKLRSVVSGTEDYDVTIELRGLNIGHEGISADNFTNHCSCPMGGDCKHVIATLIVWALDRGFILNMNPPTATTGPVNTAQATPEVDPFAHLLTQAWHGSNEQVHWMNRIIAHHDAPTKSPDTQMVWVLTPVADSGIRVKVLLCRILKNGRLSGGKKFHSIDQFLTRSGTPVDPAARAILAAIHGKSVAGASVASSHTEYPLAITR